VTSGRVYIGVVGPAEPTPAVAAAAEELGAALARRGHVVVCGGLGGVMAAASRGAHEAGGVVVGLLPGTDRGDANPWVTVALPTGLGELRNGLLVRSCDAVVAVGGSWGTLSEVALAVRAGIPVVSLGGWRPVPDAAERPGDPDAPFTRGPGAGPVIAATALEALAALDQSLARPR